MSNPTSAVWQKSITPSGVIQPVTLNSRKCVHELLSRGIAAPSAPNDPLGQPPPSYEETTGFNNSAPYPYLLPGYRMGQGAGEGHAGGQAVTLQKPLSYDIPVQMQCPSCNSTVVTRVNYKPGTLTWLVCGGLCLCGCWLGCCLIPFLMDPLLDVQHFCPKCNALLGTYKRL